MSVRRIGYVVVVVHNWSAALQFYADTLGLNLSERDDESGFARFDLPEGPPLLVENAAKIDVDDAQVGGWVGMSMATGDIDVCYRRWRSAGVEFDGPPQKQEWGGVLTHFSDPDGNRWSLVEEPR